MKTEETPTGIEHNAWRHIIGELRNTREQGDAYMAACWHPRHTARDSSGFEDGEPSCIYYPDGEAFCFGCERRTDVFDFMAHTRGWAHDKTAEWLGGGASTVSEAAPHPAEQTATPPASENPPPAQQITEHTLTAQHTPIHQHICDRRIWPNLLQPPPAQLRWLPADAKITFTTSDGQARPYHKRDAAGAAVWFLSDTPLAGEPVTCQIQSIDAEGTAHTRWSPRPLGPTAYFTAYHNPHGDEIWLLESPMDALAATHGHHMRHLLPRLPQPALIAAAMEPGRLSAVAEHLAALRLPFRLFPAADPASEHQHRETFDLLGALNAPVETYREHTTAGTHNLASHIASWPKPGSTGGNIG